MKRVTFCIAALLAFGAIASADDYPLKGTRLRFVPQASTPCAIGQLCMYYDSTATAYKLQAADGTSTGTLALGTVSASASYGTAYWGALSGNVDEENYHQWVPSTAGAPSWYIWGQRALNSDATTYNHVHHEGWNVAAGGGRIDLTKPSFNFTLESNYWNGSRFQGEIHIESTDLSNVLHRFLSIEAPHSGTGSNVLVKSDMGQIGTDAVGLAAWNSSGFNIVSPNGIFQVSTSNSGIVLSDIAPSGGIYPRVSIGTSVVNIGGNLVSDYNNGGLLVPYDLGTSGSPWGASYVKTTSYTPTTFASLGTPQDGTEAYCSDCTVANPCASGGTGAFAKRRAGAWVCN